MLKFDPSAALNIDPLAHIHHLEITRQSKNWAGQLVKVKLLQVGQSCMLFDMPVAQFQPKYRSILAGYQYNLNDTTLTNQQSSLKR